MCFVVSFYNLYRVKQKVNASNPGVDLGIGNASCVKASCSGLDALFSHMNTLLEDFSV